MTESKWRLDGMPLIISAIKREVEQFYLAPAESDTIEIRVRRISTPTSSVCYYVRKVQLPQSVEKQKFLISEEEYMALRDRRQGRVLNFTRYRTASYEFDEYHGAQEGLIIATTSLERSEIPHDFGEDITNSIRYSNPAMAKWWISVSNG